MPAQTALRLVKKCRLYLKRDSFDDEIPHVTRGIYVLYSKEGEQFKVTYIGVGGARAKIATSGVRGRLKKHDKKTGKYVKNWTHYSYFEVHDNVSGAEILELESLLLTIFEHDKRIRLDNIQHGLKALKKLNAD